MSKAVGYVGADGGSEAAGGSSGGNEAPDAQRGRIWAWCKAQGLPLDDIHAEAERSVPGRPALQAALGAAAGGVLVVDSLASLADTVAELTGVVGRMHDAGTRLVALTEGLDTASDPEGMAVRMLRGAARLAAGSPSGGPFAFARPDAGPAPGSDAPEAGLAPDEPPATPPDEAAIAALLGTVLASPPESLEGSPDGTAEPGSAPAWGDLPLDGEVGGFAEADTADADPAVPDGMRVPLEQLEEAVEAADLVAEVVEEADEPAAPDGPPPVPRGLRDVSSLQDDVVPDVVPAEAPADPAASVPPPPPASGPIVPTYTGSRPRARRRRETDYSATAEKASRHLQKGKLDKAISVWNEFLKGAEGNNGGRAWNHLGDIHARAHRHVEAADAWLKAAEAFEAAHYNHMAVAALKKVIKLDAGRPEVYRALAELNARCDRVGDAVEAYLRYARFLKDAGRLAEALEMFCRIRILDPVNARHRMQLAEELFGFGFEGEAAREAVHAADLLLERGDHAGAEEHLARWAERIPGHAGLALRLTAMAGGGEGLTRVPPAAGIEGGVLLTSGGAGRSRSDDAGWRRPDPG